MGRELRIVYFERRKKKTELRVIRRQDRILLDEKIQKSKKNLFYQSQRERERERKEKNDRIPGNTDDRNRRSSSW